MTEAKGTFFEDDDHKHIFGFLVVGKDEYELVGVRRSKIRTDFTGRKKDLPVQTDMFDDRSGDSDA